MESGDTAAAGCIIFVLFIIINSIFYGFSSAIQHINENAVEEKAKQGDKKSITIQKMLEHPTDLINTIQIIAALFNILTGYFFVRNFSAYLKVLLLKHKIGNFFSPAAADIIITVFVILICLMLLLGLGIMAPKKICAHQAQKSTYRLLPVVWLVIIIMMPVSRLLMCFSNLIVRCFGIDPHHPGDDVTEDEIIDLVDEAHEQGVIQESEAEMIQNIMEFSDKDAKDIMTHRKNMNVLDETMTLQEAVLFMSEHSNSRYPVYHESIDNIIGFIHIKDAMMHQMREEFKNKALLQIPKLIRSITFIPETRNIDSIFKSMQIKKVHMTIVVDEYGQTAGLLTMEDILEEIVGNIMDEYDESEDFIQTQFDESILMDGLTPLDDVEEVLGIDLGDHEFETLNGYLTSLLEHIPTEEDKEINANGYCFQILSVENNIIQKLRVEKNTMEEES
jgi:putative hemolysin